MNERKKYFTFKFRVENLMENKTSMWFPEYFKHVKNIFYHANLLYAQRIHLCLNQQPFYGQNKQTFCRYPFSTFCVAETDCRILGLRLPCISHIILCTLFHVKPVEFVPLKTTLCYAQHRPHSYKLNVTNFYIIMSTGIDLIGFYLVYLIY